jgi:lipopolysaccharide/colanic/teichoic acid biosynthesis glycosyltransferase
LVKPGITGLAQIQGLRGDVEDEMLNKINIQKRVDADIQYILNWSFGLDLKIFCKTFLRYNMQINIINQSTNPLPTYATTGSSGLDIKPI